MEYVSWIKEIGSLLSSNYLGSWVCVLYSRTVKQVRAKGECLGARSRGRTRIAAKRHGETQTVSDPWMSEWGNPAEKTSVSV